MNKMYKDDSKFLKDIPPTIPAEVFNNMLIMHQRDEKGNHIPYSKEDIEKATIIVKQYWRMENGR